MNGKQYIGVEMRLLILCLLVSVGCSSSGGKKGTKIEADHSLPELQHALNAAENYLGMKHKGGVIKVSYKTGTHKDRGGWWGELKTVGGVTSTLGGVNYRGDFITLYTDPRTGKIHPCPAQHEMMRSVMYSNGVRGADQDAMLKAKGWRWCR